jgi:hypothetical protein
VLGPGNKGATKRLQRLSTGGFLTAVAAAAVALAWGAIARADMTLTAAGTAQGFSLSTFSDGFAKDGANVGPVGIDVLPTALGGGVLVSDYGSGSGTVYRFATDTDGQHVSGATPSTTNYGFNNAAGIATLNGSIYMALQGTGSVVQINSNGNFVATAATGVGAATDIVADAAAGVLYVSGLGNGIWKVDPVSHSVVKLSDQTSADGMSLSDDGKTLYVAGNGGHLLAVSTVTGLVTRDLGFVPGGLDGTALGTGTLAGNIFANTNGGTVVEINLTTLAQTTIATGGTRGDLVKVDPNGSLLLTQSTEVLRLTAPPGGGFGSGVPEPSSMAPVLTVLLASLPVAVRRLRRAQTGKTGAA